MLYSQPADFIQDVNRFQLPSEDVADEMGKEAPAFVGGLSREEQTAQPVDLHLAPQEQRPDRPEGDGDGIRGFGTADKAGQSAVGGVEPVGRLFAKRRFTDEAVIQERVISGELQEADFEETEESLPGRTVSSR